MELKAVLAPQGEVLSCSDKKVPKETLPKTCRLRRFPALLAISGRSRNSQGKALLKHALTFPEMTAMLGCIDGL
jgi:hypothetical protein